MQSDFCFLWRKDIRRCFSSPASSWVLFICLVQWGFCFSAKEPCYFSKAFVYNIPSCASAQLHILQELCQKDYGLLSLGVFVMFLFSLPIFTNRDFIPLLKSGCWPVWPLFCLILVVWEERKECLNIFNKLHLWVLYCCFAVSATVCALTEDHPWV